MLAAYAAAFAALWVYGGPWHPETGAWVLGILAYFWVVVPVAVAALLASISRTEKWSWIATVFEGAMILFTVGAWYVHMVMYPDPMSGITLMIFLPFGQFFAIALFLFLVSLFGWKAKESWLKD